MNDEINVIVDRPKFLEVARVFRRNRKSFHANKVIMTLGNGQLRIEFERGGCVLPCDCPQALVAELKAKDFSGIAADYWHEQSDEKSIQLTFRPESRVFATALSGVKAKIKLAN